MVIVIPAIPLSALWAEQSSHSPTASSSGPGSSLGPSVWPSEKTIASRAFVGIALLSLMVLANAISMPLSSAAYSVEGALSQLTVKGVTIVFAGHDSLFTTQEGNRTFLRCFGSMEDLTIFYMDKDTKEFHQLCPNTMMGSSNGDFPYDDVTTKWVEKANEIGQISVIWRSHTRLYWIRRGEEIHPRREREPKAIILL
jgi:hypothetical protein